MKPKEPRISVRVDASLKSRLEAVVKETGIDEATIVRNCIEALCEHVERVGTLTFPIEVGCDHPATGIAKKGRSASAAADRIELNEPGTPYKTRKL